MQMKEFRQKNERLVCSVNKEGLDTIDSFVCLFIWDLLSQCFCAAAREVMVASHKIGTQANYSMGAYLPVYTILIIMLTRLSVSIKTITNTRKH